MSIKPNWNNLKYNIASALIFAGGVWILSIGRMATIGVLLVVASVLFGIKGGWGFMRKDKDSED